MLRLDETIVGIWFMTIPNGPPGTKGGDFLVGLNETPLGHEMTHRFQWLLPSGERYVKGWGGGRVINKTHEEMIAGMDQVVQSLTASVGSGQMHSVVRQPGETLKDFLARWAQEPWVHSHQVPAGMEEFEPGPRPR